MNESTDATLKRLAKRLSALRVTLDKSERVLLDRIILGQAVQGNHSLEKTYAGKGSRKAAGAEVRGHGIPPANPKPLAPNKDALLEFDQTTGGYRAKDER